MLPSLILPLQQAQSPPLGPEVLCKGGSGVPSTGGLDKVLLKELLEHPLQELPGEQGHRPVPSVCVSPGGTSPPPRLLLLSPARLPLPGHHLQQLLCFPWLLRLGRF